VTILLQNEQHKLSLPYATASSSHKLVFCSSAQITQVLCVICTMMCCIRTMNNRVKMLSEFNYYEGHVDKGSGVREKSKQVFIFVYIYIYL
jgi:hypothetical protein